MNDVRFHDGRHTALTRLAEAGQPDWVIQAQIGHVSPAMVKTYSHIRRHALDEGPAVLEPTFEFIPKDSASPNPSPEPAIQPPANGVTSQSTSQSDDLNDELRAIVKEVGSSGWTRTSNPPVNSRMLCH
jgi:hypothetical protein